MHSLVQALQEDRALMRDALEDLRLCGIKSAEAEASYQAAKAKRALQMKAQGHSASMVCLIIKGDTVVNKKLLEREAAKAEHQAAMEAINVYKLDARILEAQIQREWSNNGSD